MIQIDNVSGTIAESLCRKITSNLPEYFGIPEANEHYAEGVHSRQNFAASVDEEYIGLISIDFPYPNNCNIYWMAVLRHFQRRGIGHRIIEAACIFAKEKGATTMTVETLAPIESDKNYLKTYNFYRSSGFSPLLNLKPQGYEWNMVYMVKTFFNYPLQPKI